MIYWCKKWFVTSVAHSGKIFEVLIFHQKSHSKALHFGLVCSWPELLLWCLLIAAFLPQDSPQCWTTPRQDCEEFQSTEGFVRFLVYSGHCCLATVPDTLEICHLYFTLVRKINGPKWSHDTRKDTDECKNSLKLSISGNFTESIGSSSIWRIFEKPWN